MDKTKKTICKYYIVNYTHLFLFILKDACAEELRRAHLTLNSKEGGYLKARDLALRHEQQFTSSAVVQQQQSGLLNLTLSNASLTDPHQKKLKGLEKKRKNEEDALNRVGLIIFFIL